MTAGADHGGPNFMSPGGPRYPRELTYPAPFPAFSQDEIGYDYSPWLGYNEAKKLLPSPEEAEKRVQELYPHMSEAELATMTRLDYNDFRGEGEAKRESFQNVDGKWHAVVPGYNFDGSEVVLSDDFWSYTGLPAGFGPRPHRFPIPSVLSLFMTDPSQEELKRAGPWAGYLPDYFVGHSTEDNLLGRPFTLDMLYAPHPDPFQRMGKKGPASPFDFRLPPYMRLPSATRAMMEKRFWGESLYGNWEPIDNRFFPAPLPIMVPLTPEEIKNWGAEVDERFDRPVMVVSRDYGVSPDFLRSLIDTERARVPLLTLSSPFDAGTSFAAGLQPFNTLLTQKVKEMTRRLSETTRGRMSVRTFVANGLGNRNPYPSGSMRKKKVKRHAALRRVYGDNYKRLEVIDIKEGIRGPVPDVGSWTLVPQQPPSTTEQCTDVIEVNVAELTELFDHGNGVKTYGVLTGPYGELPQYPKYPEDYEKKDGPPFPPPYTVIPKGEDE
jgi:hypothetical protein